MRGPQGSNMPLVLPDACSHCDHRFPNLDEVSPEIAQYILSQHTQVCTGTKQRVRVARQSAASGVEIARRPPFSAASPPPFSQNAVAAKTQAPRKRKRYETNKMERKALLEDDIWAREVTSKSVVCNGCDSTILLDKRSEYYPGLWVKHRDKCQGIMDQKRLNIHPRAPHSESGEEDSAEIVDQVEGNSTSTTRMTNDATAYTGWGGVGSSSRGRANSTSSMSSRSSRIGTSTSMAWPSTSAHGRHSTPVYSLREEADTPPEEVDYSYVAKPQGRYMAVTHSEDVRRAHSIYDEECPRSDRGYTPSSSMSGGGSQKGARVGSDRYWSEAPFDDGSEESGTGLYRHSTRWELMNVFPGMQKRRRGDDEEMVSTSPDPQPPIRRAFKICRVR